MEERQVYIIVKNGEVVQVSDEDLSDVAEEMATENTLEAAREAGYDPEEMSPEELSEFAVSAGYDEYVYCDSVELPDEDKLNDLEEDTFTTQEGDEIEYADVYRVIHESEEDDSDYWDAEDVDWDEEGDEEDYESESDDQYWDEDDY